MQALKSHRNVESDGTYICVEKGRSMAVKGEQTEIDLLKKIEKVLRQADADSQERMLTYLLATRVKQSDRRENLGAK